MTDLEDKAVWKPCFSVDGVELPTGYFFGFSSATGDLSDNHEVLAVRLYEVDSDNPVIKYTFLLFYLKFNYLQLCHELFFRMKLLKIVHI